MRFTATRKWSIHTIFFTVTNRCGRIGMLMGLCALYPQHLFILQSLVCLEVAGSWSNHYRYEPRELMSGARMAAMFKILSSSLSNSRNSPTCLSPHKFCLLLKCPYVHDKKTTVSQSSPLILCSFSSLPCKQTW